jgi:transposase
MERKRRCRVQRGITNVACNVIGESRKKDDRMDAQMLARLARVDPQLLSPVKHGRAKAQADLTVIRARAGLAKSYGERLRGCNVRNLNPEKAEGPSPDSSKSADGRVATGGGDSAGEKLCPTNKQ